MTEPAGWERRRPRVTYALIRGADDPPPEVWIATDESAITQFMALEVIAATEPSRLGSYLDEVRQALLEERWSDALLSWMEATRQVVDVYPDEPIRGEMMDETTAVLELQFKPVFQDPGG